eukprot:469486-Lingulodinium_polyedra.AAC.1
MVRFESARSAMLLRAAARLRPASPCATTASIWSCIGCYWTSARRSRSGWGRAASTRPSAHSWSTRR